MNGEELLACEELKRQHHAIKERLEKETRQWDEAADEGWFTKPESMALRNGPGPTRNECGPMRKVRNVICANRATIRVERHAIREDSAAAKKARAAIWKVRGTTHPVRHRDEERRHRDEESTFSDKAERHRDQAESRGNSAEKHRDLAERPGDEAERHPHEAESRDFSAKCHTDLAERWDNGTMKEQRLKCSRLLYLFYSRKELAAWRAAQRQQQSQQNSFDLVHTYSGPKFLYARTRRQSGVRGSCPQADRYREGRHERQATEAVCHCELRNYG